MRALNDFDDVRALGLLKRLLVEGASVSVTAKVHLYLGIIEFNRLDTGKAREEFERAVEIDPAVEPPLTMSPKARMAFSEARRAVAVELATPVAPAPAPAPPPAVPAPVFEAETPAAETGHSHVLTWTLGACGVAVGAVAVVGLVQVLDYNSLASQANAKKNAKSSTVVAPSLSNAQAWQPWSIGLGIAAAALLATAAIVW